MSGKKTSVYFPKDVMPWIEQEAGKDHRSVSGFLTKLVREAILRSEAGAVSDKA